MSKATAIGGYETRPLRGDKAVGRRLAQLLMACSLRTL
jgi:hypothetical protein